MKLTTTIKNFKNNIIGYFDVRKKTSNLLEDLNYSNKFLILKAAGTFGYILFNDTKSELENNIFNTSDSPYLYNTKGLGKITRIYSQREPQNKTVEFFKTSNLLDSYTDIIHIDQTTPLKADDLYFKYKYNGKDPIEFKFDSYSDSDYVVTSVFIHKDILYIAEAKGTTGTNYEYGNGFKEWFDNNFKE